MKHKFLGTIIFVILMIGLFLFNFHSALAISNSCSIGKISQNGLHVDVGVGGTSQDGTGGSIVVDWGDGVRQNALTYSGYNSNGNFNVSHDYASPGAYSIIGLYSNLMDPQPQNAGTAQYYDGSCGPVNFVENLQNGSNLTTKDPITPTSITIGPDITFSTTIKNTGDVSTVNSFPYFFQFSDGSQGKGKNLFDQAFSTMYAIGPGAKDTASYTTKTDGLPAGATWSARVCADKKDRNTFGTITETDSIKNANGIIIDDPDNCSPWTDIKFISSVKPPSCSGSCNSECGKDCAPTNNCGQANHGTYQCDGTCSVSKPTDDPTCSDNKTCSNGMTNWPSCDSGGTPRIILSPGDTCPNGVTCITGESNVGVCSNPPSHSSPCIFPGITKNKGIESMTNGVSSWTWYCYDSGGASQLCKEPKRKPIFIEH